jgi:diguanylate cyclase
VLQRRSRKDGRCRRHPLSVRIALLGGVSLGLDPTLIVIALAITVLIAHMAVLFATRVKRSRGWGRFSWLLAGAVGTGVGIWSMHLVATLLVDAPARTQYDVPALLLTVLVASAVSALALHVRSRPVLPVYALVMASLLMGAAISGMRYTDFGQVIASPLSIGMPGSDISPHAQSASIAIIPGVLLILGLGLTIAAIDARERLLAREQLVRRDVELTSRLKDEFLATLSHELRTPLNVILGRTQMLQAVANDQVRVRALTETIERNSVALKKLVEDLLDVSRITLGHVRLEMQTVRLSDLLTVAAQGLQPSAHVKGITLTVDTTDPGVVTGDQTRLQQVIWNLLTNAIKFTPSQGSITAGVSRHGRQIVLSVSDSGCGIDPAFLPHVFEPFRQAESSASRVHGGLGIGLSIVRHLLELHGGTIAAQSAGPDQGSVFTVTLPAVDEHRAVDTDMRAAAKIA